MHVVVVGAGPIGLEAANAMLDAGAQVTVIERDRIGANVLRWGHVRFFSPWSMNTSPRGLAVLTRLGQTTPPADGYPTGREYHDLYLAPLAERVRRDARVFEQTEVCQIGRVGVLKSEEIGSARTGRPFRLLLSHIDGNEQFVEADAVLDCSGTYGNPNYLGPDGLPTLGERALHDRITYVIPDVLGVDRERFANRTTLLVGNGFSAATTLSLLLGLREQAEQTHVIWATRFVTPPYERIENDTLPGRDGLANLGNELAQSERAGVRYIGGCEISELRPVGTQIAARIKHADNTVEEVVVDNVVANVGYRPDNTLYRELQVHQCYASEGPMKLAASLLGSAGADCLAQPAPSAELLKNPEPGFFVLGSKSYGRNSQFLLRTGIAQIDAVLEILGLQLA
jgi:thioredoxin reductase